MYVEVVDHSGDDLFFRDYGCRFARLLFQTGLLIMVGYVWKSNQRNTQIHRH